jgi:hypothetical protein
MRDGGELPTPPLHATVGDGAQSAVTIVWAVLAFLTLLFALRHWRTSGRPTFLLLYLAGGLLVFFEPMVDTVGAVWFPTDSTVVFRAYNRVLPVWVLENYFCYFGIGVGATWIALREHITPRRLWTLFVLFIACDCGMETILLHLPTIYIYYGHQPLTLDRFPLWWAPVNSLIIIATALAIRQFDTTLRGARQLLIVPIAWTCSAACNAAAGWPSWLVINSHVGPLLRALGGIATYAAAGWILTILTQITPAPPAGAATPATRAAPKPALVA